MGELEQMIGRSWAHHATSQKPPFPPETPRRKVTTLEFDHLVFRYDYVTRVLTVGPRASDDAGGGLLVSGSKDYSPEDLVEFRAALQQLGLTSDTSSPVV